MAKKKVIFFLPKGTGGAQKMTIVISKFLSTDLYDIRYVVVGEKKVGDMTYLLNNKSSIDYINIINAWDFLTIKIIKVLRRYKPDIVFSSLMYLNIRVILAAKIIGNIKTIIRNDNMLHIMHCHNLFLLKLLYKKADLIIAQQEEMKLDLVKGLNLDESKVIVRYNPIDKDYILKNASLPSPYDDKDTIKYIWTGNFAVSGSKGQDILVKAFAIVKKKISNAQLYLLGSFDEKSDYFIKL